MNGSESSAGPEARRSLHAAGRDAERCHPGRASRSTRSRPCCRCSLRSSVSPTRNDWMSTDAEVACPDPNCPTRLRIVRTGKRQVPPCGDQRGAAARRRRRRGCGSGQGEGQGRRAMIPRLAAHARLRDLATDQGRLASGRRPWRGLDPTQATRDMARIRRGRHHDLRLRRHLYRRRGADRAIPT